MLHGKHLLKSWSSTQKVIALSSGEAEYYGIVRGAAEAIGIQSIMKDMEVETGIQVSEDSVAAKGIADRTGLGRVRHIEVNQLWVQEKVRDKIIKLRSVEGTKNLADALTKNVSSEQIGYHMSNLGCYIDQGRHEIMPKC